MLISFLCEFWFWNLCKKFCHWHFDVLLTSTDATNVTVLYFSLFYEMMYIQYITTSTILIRLWFYLLVALSWLLGSTVPHLAQYITNTHRITHMLITVWFAVLIFRTGFCCTRIYLDSFFRCFSFKRCRLLKLSLSHQDAKQHSHNLNLVTQGCYTVLYIYLCHGLKNIQ